MGEGVLAGLERGDLRLHLAWAELVGLMTRARRKEGPVEELFNCKDGSTFKKFFKCRYSDIQYRTPLILLPE